jgi:hypothetical protein
MKSIILIASCFIANSFDIRQNTFTIKNYIGNINNILTFKHTDIDPFGLDIDHDVNVISLYTGSSHTICKHMNNPICAIDINQQYDACNDYLINNNNVHMYYYGNYQQEEIFYEDENGAEQIGYYNNYNLDGMYVTHYTNESNILNISNKMDYHIYNNSGVVAGCPVWHMKNYITTSVKDEL